MFKKTPSSSFFCIVLIPVWIFFFVRTLVLPLFNQHQVLGVKTETSVRSIAPSLPQAVTIIPKQDKILIGVHVKNNHLENKNGIAMRLFGINRSGTEYSCIQNGLFSDGPIDTTAITAIRSWKINTIRIPLNQDCWLNLNGVKLGGNLYQQALTKYVATVTDLGMIVILDLHWTAPKGEKADGQQPLPDQQSITFWSQVAADYKANDKVLFDLFNEPEPLSYRNDYPGGFRSWQTDAFACVLNGCMVTSKHGNKYQGIGMQELVNAVRKTGASNIILIGGIQDSGTITQYRGTMTDQPNGFVPNDPLHNLAISTHLYNHSACSDRSCWGKTILPVAAHYPVIVTEFGDTNCTADYTEQLLPWLDTAQISYIGWTWDTWQSCEALISSYSGTPTYPYGITYKSHLKGND